MSRAKPSRRDFLSQTAAGAAAGLTMPYWLTSQGAGAGEAQSKSDRLRVGAIGVGGRGMDIARQAAELGDMVAVCDVDRKHAEGAKAACAGKPDVYDDFRKLLDRKDIDVVTNGTPDHWHTAVNIAACKAGKDVYTEKPMTLTIDEGKILCKVVEDTKRIVQVGTQQRSEKVFQTAVELVRNGRVGKLQQVWVALPYFSTKGGPFDTTAIPESLNWDVYQGQAPLHDYCLQRTHQNFRWWYEYAGGIVTDWGNHHMDIAHWGMDCEHTGPTSVEARAVFPNPVGTQFYNTPDRFFARMTYPNGVELLYFSSLGARMLYGQVEGHQATTPEQIERLFGRGVPEEIRTFNRDGIMFIGDKGRVFVNRGGVYGKPAEELKDNPLPEGGFRVYPSRNHMGNFFECVKSRKTPVSTVQMQHRTITACHLTNISLRLKRKITWDPEKQEIVGDPEANGWQRREQRKPYVVEG